MKDFNLLFAALDYIEGSLQAPLAQRELAAACHCSLSALQKMFRFALHVSLNEYISKRRLSCAARELLESEHSVTEIALRYQYNSPEVFTRAFTRTWNMPPSAFKRQWRKFTGLFPRIVSEGGGGMPINKQKDISELYDYLKERQGCYVICFDMTGLTHINDISYETGDKAILECLHRLDEAAGDDMLPFRIGGDEFALVTSTNVRAEAESIANAVLAKNGGCIEHNGQSVPVSMRAAALRMESSLKYNQVFEGMHEAIQRARIANALTIID